MITQVEYNVTDITKSVPQGSILVQILLTLNVYDVEQSFTKVNFTLYADYT